MKRPRRRLALAIERARDVLAQRRIRAPEEIDIRRLAASFDVHVQFDRLASEEGHLSRTDTYGLITVDDRATESWKWRFVIAHELGHFFLHGDVDQFEVCSDIDLHAWYQESGHEPEANAFASELLMPSALFGPRCRAAGDHPSLKRISELAEEFQTSLSATALRFLDFCDESCAVAQCNAGVICWWERTDDFPFFLRKGYRPTPDTYAYDLMSGCSADGRPHQMEGDSWSDDTRAEGVEVWEHSMPLGRYGVLTLLWSPDRAPVGEWDGVEDMTDGFQFRR